MEKSEDDEGTGEPPCKKRLLNDTFFHKEDVNKIDTLIHADVSETLNMEDISSLHKEDDDMAELDDGSKDTKEEELPSDSDAYTKHFEYNLLETAANIGKLRFDRQLMKWPEIGTFNYLKPILQNNSLKEPNMKKADIAEFQLKKNLLDTVLGSSRLKKLSKVQIGLFNLISDYFDILYMKRTHEKGENLRFLYTLHILNHILKSRAKVIHHNSKLAKNPKEEYRDQGFARTVSVILVPFRHDCHQIVSHLLSLLPDCVVKNRKRFKTEYGPPPEPPQRIKNKPPDFYETFKGNINEDFKIGLKIQNKSVTLYSKFYSSDLIIASPLGLRQIVGAEGDKDRDYDFLASVEVLVIDRAEVLMLQNIANFFHILEHFNMPIKRYQDWDLYRVRHYALDGMSKYFRQTIFLASVENPCFEPMLQNFCFNYSGYLASVTKSPTPAIDNILVPMKMCFRFFDTENFETEIEDRFNFFVNKVLPDYKAEYMAQTLVYIPSYYDFTRLRNYFRGKELSSVMVCEYSKKGKIAQARNVFFKGYRHFMLYTERAHFYSRYHIKGIQHILFYQLPTYPGYFRELCNAMVDSNPRREFEQKSCCVVASRLEWIQLKHIVGMNETKRMHESKQNIFVKDIKEKIII